MGCGASSETQEPMETEQQEQNNQQRPIKAQAEAPAEDPHVQEQLEQPPVQEEPAQPPVIPEEEEQTDEQPQANSKMQSKGKGPAPKTQMKGKGTPSNQSKSMGKASQNISIQSSTPIFYFEPGTGSFTDLSGVCYRQPIQIYNEQGYFNGFDKESFKSTVTGQEKVVFIISADSREAIKFLALCNNEIEFTEDEQKKIHCIYITSTHGTPAIHKGSTYEALKMYVLLTGFLHCQHTFVERQNWFGTSKKAEVIQEILEKNEPVGFYPNGCETRNVFKGFLDNGKNTFFPVRAFCHSICMEGVGEQLLHEELAHSYFSNDYQSYTAQPLDLQEPVSYGMTSGKLFVTMGNTVDLVTQNVNPNQIVSIDDLNESYEYGDKELIFVFNPKDQISLPFLQGKIMEWVPNNNNQILLCILPEEKTQAWFCVAQSLENTQGQIFVDEYNPNIGLLLKSLANMDSNVGDIFQHSVPFPRQNFLTPYFNGEPLWSTSSNLSNEKTSFASVSFNQAQNIPDAFYCFVSFPNRQRVFKSCPEATGLTLVANYEAAMELTTLLVNPDNREESVQKIVDTFGSELDKDNIGFAHEGITDLSSEYQTYKDYEPEQEEEAGEA